VQCTGASASAITSKIAVKFGMIGLVCFKLLDKASTRTYTATTGFATIVFTAQTVALAVKDSFGQLLQSEAPGLNEFLDFWQSVLNPDQETPEKCMFSSGLFTNLVVEAVLPPLIALAITLVVSLSWHICGYSCGLRFLCNKKRIISDRLKGKWERFSIKAPKFHKKRPRLTKEWRGERLLSGTYARFQKEKEYEIIGGRSVAIKESITRRTSKLNNSDIGRVWVAPSTMMGPQSSDYDKLDSRQLRRLLRSLNITTTDETDAELKRHLRFQLECEDRLFDDSLMPQKLARPNLKQACMYVRSSARPFLVKESVVAVYSSVIPW
jgi:hypothetical protein